MLRQIERGVKKVDTSGRSTTMRSTQPVPWETIADPRK